MESPEIAVSKALQGKRVRIYQDPISRQDPEGWAKVLEMRLYDPCCSSYQIAHCMVEFEEDPGSEHFRAIRVPLKEEAAGY